MVSENIFSWFLKESIEINKLKSKDINIDDKKRKLLEDLIDKVNKESKARINFVQSLIDKTKEALSKDGNFVIDVNAKTLSRLMVNTANGLGHTVFEVGLAFHPIFNLPYIPSSSIKGSLRSYIHFDNEDKEREIFGSQEKAGYLIVLDAFPLNFNKNLLEADVTTPIYAENIEEHKAKPTPIIYPCIAKGVTFRFVIGISNRIYEKLRKELKDQITEYFFKMVSYGIGAKTLLGYGELEKVR